MSIDPASFTSPIERGSHPFGAASTAGPSDGVSGVVTAVFGEDGFTFGDLLDIVNPLQHLPVISTLYRHFTDDDLAPGPRLLGGGLFGGLIGAGIAFVNLVIEQGTGEDLGGHVLALLTGDESADGERRSPPVPAPANLASLAPDERTAALLTAVPAAITPDASPTAATALDAQDEAAATAGASPREGAAGSIALDEGQWSTLTRAHAAYGAAPSTARPFADRYGDSYR